MKNNLDIILGFAMLIGIAYRVFQVEKAIYDAIKTLKDLLVEEISNNERDFAIHKALYQERTEHVDYLLHGLEEKIDHKFNRLFEEFKEMKAEQKYRRKED